MDVFTANAFGRASVPSGASTGLHAALEVRDGGRAYQGLSVNSAVSNVNNILAKKIVGMNVSDQESIDNLMITIDGTDNKSRLGANAILGVSLAVTRCAANVNNKPLYSYLGTKKVIPIPISNFINGGKHSVSQLNIQEFWVVPSKVKNFAEATQALAETYYTLRKIVQGKYGKLATNVGDEGGLVPPLVRATEALDLLTKAIDERGYGKQLFLGIDAAASTFYNWKLQQYNVENKKLLDRGEMIDYYKDLIGNYKLAAIEDPFDQDDFESFKELTAKTKIQIIGDDLLVTNPKRIATAIDENLCNSLLLKPNQIGTLTETYEANKLATKAEWKVIASHRSGETNDSFIADLAVGLGCGQVKIGAPNRGERLAKFNRLLRIEEELGGRAKYGLNS